MTSWHGNDFHITVPLWGWSTGHRAHGRLAFCDETKSSCCVTFGDLPTPWMSLVANGMSNSGPPSWIVPTIWRWRLIGPTNVIMAHNDHTGGQTVLIPWSLSYCIPGKRSNGKEGTTVVYSRRINKITSPNINFRAIVGKHTDHLTQMIEILQLGIMDAWAWQKLVACLRAHYNDVTWAPRRLFKCLFEQTTNKSSEACVTSPFAHRWSHKGLMRQKVLPCHDVIVWGLSESSSHTKLTSIKNHQ